MATAGEINVDEIGSINVAEQADSVKTVEETGSINIKVIGEGFDDKRILLTETGTEAQLKQVDSVFDELKSEVAFNDKSAKTLKATSEGEEGWIGGSSQAYEQSKKAKIMLAAYKELLNKEDMATTLSASTVNLKASFPLCPKQIIPCNRTKYRNPDGICNNLNATRTWWGSSESPLKRLLRSDYDDGVTEPRVRSVRSKMFLPNARSVSLNVFSTQPQQRGASDWSLLFVYFAKLLSLDISSIAQTTDSQGNRIRCRCNSHQSDCFNIPVPRGDQVNSDQKCMSYVRSLASVRDFDCNLGPREQLNLQTSWVDMSFLYGTNRPQTQSLRKNVSGLLLVDTIGKNQFLPSNPKVSCSNSRQAPDYSRRQRCFLTGDPRVQDNAALLALQTVFLREHNRIAKTLNVTNPTWDEQKVFNNARKILNGVFQNIVYGEFLPALLGERLAKLYQLLPLKQGYTNIYSDSVYPQAINEFSSAAFRLDTFFPNSVGAATNNVNGGLRRNEGRPISFYQFNDQYYRNNFDEILPDLLRSSSLAPGGGSGPQVSKYFGDYFWNGLFTEDSKRWSVPALDVQRGRDHGLPAYNKYRELCGVGLARSWTDLTNIPTSTVQKLKKLYASVDDIDLYVGISSERPLKNALLGAVGGCLVAKQFRDLKVADRFYFETSDPDIQFTVDQLNSIRGQTIATVMSNNINNQDSMATVLANNINNLDSLPKFSFFASNRGWNTRVSITNLKTSSINLGLWAEKATTVAATSTGTVTISTPLSLSTATKNP